MPAPIDICFYAQDPPQGRFVATKTEGIGQIHLLRDYGEKTLCGSDLDGMATGVVRGELDTDHSDFCQRCAKADG